MQQRCAQRYTKKLHSNDNHGREHKEVFRPFVRRFAV
jgi:hypothetical protein